MFDKLRFNNENRLCYRVYFVEYLFSLELRNNCIYKISFQIGFKNYLSALIIKLRIIQALFLFLAAGAI